MQDLLIQKLHVGGGIKFLGFDASQVDGTRAIQQKKTPYTHLQCRRLGPQ